ncbi:MULTISPECIES: MEKHLA domain-containing protein [unclassified Endozoicomonas]|uniref:MEKHLA domain-containing protein n=1 Tax=unclassified Endozoicomonas TaxID=2644528 RepID=UPI0021494ADF|nr:MULTISPECIES: MEKHLA domain-containing protein [unclassified Endozoicomonas]
MISPQDPFLQQQGLLMANSYHTLTGQLLCGLPLNDSELGKKLYEHPSVILSHGTESDPVFCYGNLSAQSLFEMDWNTLTQMPSRHSAEQLNREERDRLLKIVSESGYIKNYSGIRVSSTGRRFLIEQAVVWNLYDEEDKYRGQAAKFNDWTFL